MVLSCKINASALRYSGENVPVKFLVRKAYNIFWLLLEYSYNILKRLCQSPNAKLIDIVLLSISQMVNVTKRACIRVIVMPPFAKPFILHYAVLNLIAIIKGNIMYMSLT